MAEMYTGKPLFPGKTNEDQLFRIFKLLGTPSEMTWPRVSDLPDYKPTFPIYPPIDLHIFFPSMTNVDIDLLLRTLQYQPALRISAKDALSHIYFGTLMTSSSSRFS
jgi:negative regulator of PHO system